MMGGKLASTLANMRQKRRRADCWSCPNTERALALVPPD
jgi:hypothetical protein